MYKRNRPEIYKIVRAVKERYPDKDIWMWTGFKYEYIKNDPILEYIDVLIDGRYKEHLPTDKPWRGSDNQRLLKLT